MRMFTYSWWSGEWWDNKVTVRPGTGVIWIVVTRSYSPACRVVTFRESSLHATLNITLTLCMSIESGLWLQERLWFLLHRCTFNSFIAVCFVPIYFKYYVSLQVIRIGIHGIRMRVMASSVTTVHVSSVPIYVTAPMIVGILVMRRNAVVKDHVSKLYDL